MVFQARKSVYLTDGTPEGTKAVLPVEGDVFIVNDKLVVIDIIEGALAYDPVTEEVTNLTFVHPNVPGNFFDPDRYTLTENGLLFIATTPEAGRELYITNGTSESTRLLTEINPGPEDGITWQGDPGPETIDGNIVFRRGPDEDSQEIWISDGSEAGTYKLFDLTDETLLAFGEMQGTSFDETKILLTAQLSSASTYPTYLFSVDIEASVPGAVAVDTLPNNLLGDARYPFGDRVLIDAGYFSGGGDQLLSYGAEAGDPIVVRNLSSFEELVYVGPDFILLMAPSSGLAADTLMISRGQADDFIPLLLFDDMGLGQLQILEINGEYFAYCFTEELGESIHQLNLEENTTSLVVDLFDHNAASDIQQLLPVGGQLLVSQSNVEHLLLSPDGTQQEPITADDNAVTPSRFNGTGTIENKHYFFSGSGSGFNHLSELNTETKTLRRLDDLIPDDLGFITREPTLLDDVIYTTISSTPTNPSRIITHLVAINPVTEQVDIITSDTTTDMTNRIGGNLATDGEYLYFSQIRDGGTGPVAYNPQSGEITAIGEAQTSTSHLFRYIGEQMYALYGFQDQILTTFPISLAGVGEPFPLSFVEQSVEITDLSTIILSKHTGNLFATNKLTKDTILLIASSSTSLRNITRINDHEAIFMLRDDSNSPYELWRTNGSQAGTRKVLTFPTDVQTSPSVIRVFGNYVAIALGHDDVLYLFDPSTEWIERVDIELENNGNLITTIENNLYTYGNDEVFGREIHRIRATDQQLVEGTVFRDANTNGIQEETEGGVPNRPLRVSSGSTRTLYTNADGHYVLPVKDGESYTLSLSASGCQQTVTTPDEYQFQYHPDSTFLLDFGLTFQQGPAALRTLLNSSTIRCGFEHDFWLTILNDGCQPLAGEAAVTFLEDMEFFESDETPLSNEDNTLTFAFDTLQPNASRRIRIRFRMPDENFAGQVIDLGAVAGAMSGQGAMITSDTFAYGEILRCAIDPNDKQVSPSRPEPSNSNYTQFDETLRYTIRFQNTGNDTAFTVRIQDQIDESLNLETFKPLAASHPYSVSVRDDRTVVFLFDNILLPDSTTNLPGSQGFVTFEINAYPGLDDFSTIPNTAGIYFDFNQPVITNTVTSTLVEFLDQDQDGFLFYEDCDDEVFAINPAAAEIPNNGIDENCDDLDDFPVSTTEALSGTLEYFPNPTSDELTLRYSNNTPLHGELYAANGTRLRSFVFQNTHNLSLEEFPAGLYLVRLFSEEGRGAVIRVVRD